MEAYGARPAYQQNDYVCSLCVTRAKQEPTKQKRLDQMLNELESGDVYMNVKVESEVIYALTAWEQN